MVKIHGLSHGKHQKERVNVALINLRVTVSGRIAQILPLTEYLAVKFLCLLIAVYDFHIPVNHSNGYTQLIIHGKDLLAV